MSDEIPITEADLQAYADERLGAGRRAEVEAWLAAHPDEAERIASYRRVGEELRSFYEPVLAEPVPESLEHAASGKRRSGGARPRWRVAALAAIWTAFVATLGTLAGWQLHASRPTPVAALDGVTMARRAAVAHAVYSPEVRHPVEVGADQEQHLVTWLSKRLGVKVKAPMLDEAGMSLVGGRLLPGETGPVAQFMYQTDRGRRMTLYVRAESAPHRETAFRYARENNVGVFYWLERDCSYAIASSDLSKEELLAIATTVYKQLSP
jgi:anti-sigma factor RsiW